MTKVKPEEEKLLTLSEDLKNFYREAFDDFDWNRNGRIATRVYLSFIVLTILLLSYIYITTDADIIKI